MPFVEQLLYLKALQPLLDPQLMHRSPRPGIWVTSSAT